MFRKRTPKVYPPGTFIPTPARVFAILQLCLAFTLLLWYASQPFMGDLFRVRSQMLIYQAILNDTVRFSALSAEEQTALIEQYSALQNQLEVPFPTKIGQALAIILKLPAFKLAWLILSCILPILLLKKVEGAASALWLLPLLTAAFALDNRLTTFPRKPTAEERLFPTEKALVDGYLDESTDALTGVHQEQLRKAWANYLTREWAPKSDPTPEAGFFAFNKARALALTPSLSHPYRESGFWLTLYFMWNLAFAGTTLLTLGKWKSTHHYLHYNQQRINCK